MTLMLIATVVVFGLFSYPKIGVDQFPDINFPVVTITTVLPGADPQTIETNVTEPLEEVLNTLSGLDTLRSTNVENVSIIVVQFDLEQDVDVAAQDIRDKVQATLSKLPQDIETPVVQKFDMGSAPIVTLALSGPLPPDRLTKLAEDEVKPGLQQIAGVGDVELVGTRAREIRIEVDPVRLRAHGLAASDVVAAVRAQHVQIPGGRTAEPGLERTVTLLAEAAQVSELRDLVVASPAGHPVRLRDVATIHDGPAEARSLAMLDEQPAIGMIVRKQSGANTVQVAEAVNEWLGEYQAQLPPGSRLQVVSDNSKFIKNSIESVKHDLLLGGILAVVVVLVFLRNWRSTLVSAVALPTSVIGTFAAMHALGFTFNLITMVALTLSIGLLIDDAIVVIENIVRHMEEGQSPAQAAAGATKEIAVAVLAVTMAVVAVFVPVAFMQGIMGRFFYQFGVTVAIAVLISYVVSMTLTPTLSARVLKVHGKEGPVSRALEAALQAIEKFYRRTLGWVLRHRAITLVGAVGVMIGTVGLATGMKFAFIPEQDMSMINVKVEMPAGTPLEGTAQQLAQLRQQLRKLPGIVDTFSTAGAGTQQEVHKGEILVNMVPVAQRDFTQATFKQYLRDYLKVGPGVRLSVANASMMGSSGSETREIQYALRGNNFEELQQAADKLRDALSKHPGFVDVDVSYRAGKPQLDVKVDRERAASVGVAAASVGQTLRVLLGRDKVADFRQEGETIEIKVELPESVRAQAEALGMVQVRGSSGRLVDLRDIGEIQAGTGPAQIDHLAQMRQVTVLADLKGMSLSEAMSVIQDYTKRDVPPTIRTEYQGQAKELGNAMTAFAMALLLGIVLVFIILAAQFESLLDPFSIMMALPLAVIGAIGSLLMAGEYMSIFAMIGMIMLMGLVTKNGILLVEFTNQLREQGLSTHEALLRAGPIRLRPILMTTVAMVAGMIPVAVARGDGAETRVPMALAVIGGLITSTILTLAVVPAVYSVLDSARQRVFKKAAPQPSFAQEPARAAE